MASTPVNALKASLPKDAFCIFNNGNFEYPNPIVKREFISVIHKDLAPVAEFFLPALDPTTVWVLYPEHFGHFLTALTTDGLDIKSVQNIVKTVNAAFELELEEPATIEDVTFEFLGKLLAEFTECPWTNREPIRSSVTMPLHLAYLAACGLYAKAVISVGKDILMPIFAVCTSGYFEGHTTAQAAAVYMKPMFVVVNDEFTLFRGFCVKQNLQDYGEDDDLKWTGELLKRGIMSKYAHMDKYSDVCPYAPAARDRMMSAPMVPAMKQEAQYEIVDKLIKETVNTDVAFGMFQSVFFAACKNMNVEHSVFYDQEAMSSHTFEEYVAEVSKESVVMSEVLLGAHNTILKVVSAGVTVSSSDTPPFGAISPTVKDRNHTMCNMAIVDTASVCQEILKAICSKSGDMSGVINKITEFGRGSFGKVYKGKGFKMYGSYSAFNSYGSCVDAVNLTTTCVKELIQDFSDPDLPKYAFFMSAEALPFCYATLSVVIRQCIFGAFVTLVMPVGLSVGENYANVKHINKEVANALGKITRLLIPFKFPKPINGESSEEAGGVVANTFDVSIGQNNQTIKNKMFGKGKSGKTIRDLPRCEFLRPVPEMNDGLCAILKKNVPGMVKTVLQNDPSRKFLTTIFTNPENNPISHQRMMTTPAAFNGSPVLTDIYIQMYRRQNDVVLSMKWNTDMFKGVYIAKIYPNASLTLEHRKGFSKDDGQSKAIVESVSDIDIPQAVLKLMGMAKGFTKTINVSTINSLYPLISEDSFTTLVGKLKDLKTQILEDETPSHAVTIDETDTMYTSMVGSPTEDSTGGVEPIRQKRKAEHNVEESAAKMAKMITAAAGDFDVNSDDEC